MYRAFVLQWVLADLKLLGSTSGTKHADLLVYNVLSFTGLGGIHDTEPPTDYSSLVQCLFFSSVYV